MYDFNLTTEERSQQKVTKFDWYMPCKFDYNKEGEQKDMFLYYMLYNQTLTESNTLTNLANNQKKDPLLLSLKMAMDNAVLEYKAIEKGLDYIPRIDMSL